MKIMLFILLSFLCVCYGKELFGNKEHLPAVVKSESKNMNK